jgi:uncharacterized protein
MTHQATVFPNLAGHQYMRLSTFRKNGQEVPTPVWFTESDGKLYVYTRPEAGKIKRIRANGRAEMAPCDARGTLLGPSAPGKARILPPEDANWVEALFVAKYGLQFRLFSFLGRLQRATPAYIEIAPGGPA